MPQLTWLITGCSSRFGEQFVPSILARGDRVIITARGDIKRLSHWESSGAKALVLDVTASQTKLNEIIQQAISLFDGIDVLVNNAGYVESGLVEEASSERFLAQLQTNYFGALNVSRAVLPHFREKKAGTIVFIGSVGGWAGHVSAGP